jgi:hypothetical protein
MGSSIGQMAGQGFNVIGQGIGMLGEQAGDFIQASGLGDTVSSFVGTGAKFDQRGNITEKGTGLFGWAQENPALTQGLVTTGLGMSQGVDPSLAYMAGGDTASRVQQGIDARQMGFAQQDAAARDAQMQEIKLLADIEKSRRDIEIAAGGQGLDRQKAQQSILEQAQADAQKAFPKDPRAQQEYAQALVAQRTKGGKVAIGRTGGFLGIGSRPDIRFEGN